jgi:glyoxylase-like metal-dependent hydrolase (beta-lactamase superfamily II)
MTFTITRRAFAALGSAALLLAGCATMERDAQDVLRMSERAMGGGNLRTLRYAGRGTGGIFGQAYDASQSWPRLSYSSFSRDLDYENGAMREDFVRTRAERTGGGGLPLLGLGNQSSTGMLRGVSAWNVAGQNATAAPLAVDGRIHDLWTTPHGVIKAALKNKATVRTEDGRSIVSFTEPGRYTAVVRINAEGLVERIDSVQPNPVLGDTKVVTRYTNYRDYGGVKFPSRIVQEQGGFAALEIDVAEVVPNAPVAIEVPASVPAFTERVTAEKAADGVWFLGGGSHNSVAIEMKDHVILVESPLYDGRALAVIAETKRLIPGKPIRYVINSHHHFDHAGGLRTAVAEGATLVTSEQARGWFEQVLATPNTISPDAMARSGRKATITGVNVERTFTDGDRTVQVYQIQDSVHARGFQMVWLPREKILIEADAYTPGAPNSPPPSPLDANQQNLVMNIGRVSLDPAQILPLHGRMVPIAELYRSVGR